jgi:hypothetical protein
VTSLLPVPEVAGSGSDQKNGTVAANGHSLVLIVFPTLGGGGGPNLVQMLPYCTVQYSTYVSGYVLPLMYVQYMYGAEI